MKDEKYALCLALKPQKFKFKTNTKCYIYDLGWKFELVLVPKFDFYVAKN